jgi:TPR repeat protein
MKPLTVPMTTTLMAALFCAASLVLSCARAQQGDAVTKQLISLRTQAEKGDALSQFDLGMAFYSGKFGMATNYAEAVKWFRHAAEQNLAGAQYNLGCCYAKGQGVGEDQVVAATWIRKAAEQGDAQSQYNLALCYVHGEGVTKDKVQAVKWFRRAAEQNEGGSQYNLAMCYAVGQGVEKDAVEAAKGITGPRNRMSPRPNLT